MASSSLLEIATAKLRPHKPYPPSLHGSRTGLQAQRLRQLRGAHGLRRGLEGRVAVRQRRLRAVHLRDQEDGGALRPPLLRLAPAIGRRPGRRLSCQGARPRVRDYATMADFSLDFSRNWPRYRKQFNDFLETPLGMSFAYIILPLVCPIWMAVSVFDIWDMVTPICWSYSHWNSCQESCH
ncbi:hypothetical protein Acr_03g0006990 [Actinidia rufa]|uniref:Uncharacterized protein n=1 Tax=Actinidia rufa TaxID=165716 RepID=A0A7J0EBY0_9ERIC|nr:hypothetical protein Acr_03g0006990 [Actinidia rufa]